MAAVRLHAGLVESISGRSAFQSSLEVLVCFGNIVHHLLEEPSRRLTPFLNDSPRICDSCLKTISNGYITTLESVALTAGDGFVVLGVIATCCLGDDMVYPQIHPNVEIAVTTQAAIATRTSIPHSHVVVGATWHPSVHSAPLRTTILRSFLRETMTGVTI